MPSGRRDPGAGRPLTGVPALPASRGTPSRSSPVQARQQPSRPRPASGPSLLPLLLWPVLISVAITGLRLLGEVRRWSPEYWSPLPGGGLSPLGIAWLVPLVGLYLGWQLQRRGLRAPSLLQAAVQPPLALALAGGILLLLDRLRTAAQMRALTWNQWLTMWAVAAVVALGVGLLAWPTLGRLLLAYALAARAVVAAVMALAINRGLGTHYDAAPPGFPRMSALRRWLWTGLLPQLTIWVAITVGVGVLFGALGWLAAARYARYRAQR